ncbi:hypothetical protein AD943_05790 [Gluconobacter roseus]|nr:hypothetical protein AD943_05790 [Gluconobacter roseus]
MSAFTAFGVLPQTSFTHGEKRGGAHDISAQIRFVGVIIVCRPLRIGSRLFLRLCFAFIAPIIGRRTRFGRYMRVSIQDGGAGFSSRSRTEVSIMRGF